MTVQPWHLDNEPLYDNRTEPIVEQSEYPEIAIPAQAGRENASGVPIVDPEAVPGPDTVTLQRPLCVDGEFYPGEWETRTGTLDTTGATA